MDLDKDLISSFHSVPVEATLSNSINKSFWEKCTQSTTDHLKVNMKLHSQLILLD